MVDDKVIATTVVAVAVADSTSKVVAEHIRGMAAFVDTCESAVSVALVKVAVV